MVMEYTKEEIEKYEEMKLFFKKSTKEQRQAKMMLIPFFKDQIEKKEKDKLYNTCSCGSVVKNSYMQIHLKSKKHQKLYDLLKNG